MSKAKELIAATISATAIFWSAGENHSKIQHSPVHSATVNAEKQPEIPGISAEEFKKQYQEFYERLAKEKIGYQNINGEGHLTEINIPFIKNGKPVHLTLNNYIILWTPYPDLESEIDLSKESNPHWIFPNDSTRDLTDLEMKNAIDELNQDAAIAQGLEKYQEPKASSPITEDEFNKRFDELLKEADERFIGIPFNKNLKRQETGRDIYYLDPKSGVLMRVTMQLGYKFFNGYDYIPDSSARSIEVYYYGVHLPGKSVSSTPQEPPSDYWGIDYLASEDKLSSNPKVLSGQERANILLMAQIAIENALPYIPVPLHIIDTKTDPKT